MMACLDGMTSKAWCRAVSSRAQPQASLFLADPQTRWCVAFEVLHVKNKCR